MKWENLGNGIYLGRIDLESSVNSGKNKMSKVTLDNKTYTVNLDVYEQVKKLLNGQTIVDRTDALDNDLELARKQQMDRICKGNL